MSDSAVTDRVTKTARLGVREDSAYCGKGILRRTAVMGFQIPASFPPGVDTLGRQLTLAQRRFGQYTRAALRTREVWVSFQGVTASDCGGSVSVTVRETEVHEESRVMSLLNRWLRDDSDYDLRVWPTVKANLENNRLSSRPRFAD